MVDMNFHIKISHASTVRFSTAYIARHSCSSRRNHTFAEIGKMYKALGPRKALPSSHNEGPHQHPKPRLNKGSANETLYKQPMNNMNRSSQIKYHAPKKI